MGAKDVRNSALLGFVAEKEVCVCLKLTGVGLSVRPDKETGSMSRDFTLVMSVSEKEFTNVALGDFISVCHGNCLLRCALYNSRDSLLTLEYGSSQFTLPAGTCSVGLLRNNLYPGEVGFSYFSERPIEENIE